MSIGIRLCLMKEIMGVFTLVTVVPLENAQIKSQHDLEGCDLTLTLKNRVKGYLSLNRTRGVQKLVFRLIHL